MKKYLTIILLLGLFSCDKDDNPKVKDLSLLQGNWRISSQTIATIPTDGYVQFHTMVDTSDAARVDTIMFGIATFRFSAYNENNFYNTFNLSSEKVRELFALYSIGGPLDDSLQIRSVVNSYMLQDTTIEGYRTSFSQMIQLDYKIESLSASKLQLSHGEEKLELEKTE